MDITNAVESETYGNHDQVHSIHLNETTNSVSNSFHPKITSIDNSNISTRNRTSTIRYNSYSLNEIQLIFSFHRKDYYKKKSHQLSNVTWHLRYLHAYQ